MCACVCACERPDNKYFKLCGTYGPWMQLLNSVHCSAKVDVDNSETKEHSYVSIQFYH